MRLVLTGGGTGGHVYPALTVLDWLRANVGEVDALYIGSEAGMERGIVERAGVPFVAVPAAAVRGKNPIRALLGVGASARGIRAAGKILRGFRPNAVLATGGYVSTPAVLAARLAGIRSVVYLPDVAPGWAVRFLARFSTVVAASTESALVWLPKARVVVTGYPTRPEFAAADATRGRLAFGIPPARDVVTVTGGSSGARRINESVANRYDLLSEEADVVHVTGTADFERTAAKATGSRGVHVRPYIEAGMADLLAASRLIISRAGASVLGEYTILGRASLLVPGPFSGQGANAAYMQERGASAVLQNEAAEQIPARALQLLRDPAALDQMGRCARAMSRADAAASIAELLRGEAA